MASTRRRNRTQNAKPLTATERHSAVRRGDVPALEASDAAAEVVDRAEVRTGRLVSQAILAMEEMLERAYPEAVTAVVLILPGIGLPLVALPLNGLPIPSIVHDMSNDLTYHEIGWRAEPTN